MDLLTRYAAVDSTAVSDALDAQGLPRGTGAVRPVWGHRPLVGFATTVQLGPFADGPAGPHIGTAAIDQSGPDHVVVISNEGRTDVSSWGGLLSLGASRNGVRGAIIDGACRDVPEARELAFPIYALASVPTTARGRLRQISINENIFFQGIPVEAGDVVVADETGVVIVPRDKAEDVLRTAEAVTERERSVAADIRAGVRMQDALHDARLAGTAGEKSA